MAHALAIVIGEDWTSVMRPHCIHKSDGTEGEGQFDWCEEGGCFGRLMKFITPQKRRGLLGLFPASTHCTRARRGLIDIEALRDQFGFVVVSSSGWHEPTSFEEARQLIETVPGDPVLTAVDYHM